jgi:hypothetical protein
MQGYKLFIFSDEINTARIEYKRYFPKDAIWVDENGALSHLETLFVMSFGSAFVIANSTFSWWSAFLSESPDVVIAPQKWYRNKIDPEDLIPPNWKREDSQWAD